MMAGPDETVVTVVEANGQTPATSAILGALGNLASIMSGIRSTLERRERLSPGVFRPPFTTSLRLRVMGIIISTNAGDSGETATSETVVADAAATDSLGRKLAYAVPVGARAIVHMAGFLNNLGNPTVNLNLIRGANTITIASGTAQRWVQEIALEAGDEIELSVIIAAAAGSSSDFFISVTQFAENTDMRIQLRVGSDPILSLRPLVGTTFLEFPVTIDRGQDVRVIDVASGADQPIDPVGNLAEFAIVAYTE